MKKIWEQQKEQLKKSLEERNREFEKLNADLLTARERNDVEQITKYQKMLL
jgi:hypothetical protein